MGNPVSRSSGASASNENLFEEVASSETAQRADSADLLAVLRESLSNGSQLPAAIMQAATDAARILSEADGVALALRTKGMIVCRARSGELAPDLGTPLNADSGISGECLRSASIQVCNDTANDTRVDPEVCSLMGIRSIVVVPLRGPVGMAGILEAFATRVHAFGEEQINSLRELAGIAESAYDREANATKEAALASLRAARSKSLFSAGSVEPAANQDSSQVLEEPSLARRYWVIGAATAAVLLVLGVWLSGREPGPEAAASEPRPTQARSIAVEATRNPAPLPAAKPKAGVSHPVVRGDKDSGGLKNAAEVTIETVDNSRPATATTARLENAPSGPANTARVSVPDPEPPQVTMGGQATAGPIASLAAAPDTLPMLEARVSAGVTQGQLTHRVEPVYPVQARAQRLEGNVVLDVRIGEDGIVRDVKTISGSPILAAAAMTAVKQWRYSPFLLSGKPTAVQKQLTVIYKLP